VNKTSGEGLPPMRVALVSQEYPPETAHGGIGSQTYLKAHGLASVGHDVHVVSHSTDGRQREYVDGGVTVTRIPGGDQRLPIYTEPARWLTYSAEVAATVAQLHARAPLDIVDFPEWGAEGYVHLINRTEWNHIPTVVHLHGPLVMFAHAIGWPEIDSEFYRVGTAMESTCLRLADAVFSSSHCSADWCVRNYGLRRDPISILHTGVDLDLFQPPDVPKNSRPTIIFVGKIVRNKGVELLLDAACRLATECEGLQLRMLGRGDLSLLEELRATALARGLPELLDLPGFVDRQELPLHLSRAHVFAAPSIYEGGPGFVYLEAMACGLPVVGCSGSGASEAITPEETGLLVAPGDLGALVGALRRLLSDPAECQAMGQRALRHVQSNANSKSCLRQLEMFYSAVSSGQHYSLREDFTCLR
jgi:glycogen synthase